MMKFFTKCMFLLLFCGLFAFADNLFEQPASLELCAQEWAAEQHTSDDCLMPLQHSLLATASQQQNHHVSFKIRSEKRCSYRSFRLDNSRIILNHKCHEINQFIKDSDARLHLFSRPSLPNYLLIIYQTFLI